MSNGHEEPSGFGACGVSGFSKRTLLCASFDDALARRKACAGADAFGIEFTTPFAFVANAWDAWGDARRIVGAQERLVFVLQALSEQDELACTLGTARLVARFAAEFAGVAELEGALVSLGAGDAFTAAERAVLDVVSAYLDALDACGLIEEGQAAALLADLMPPCAVECADGVTLTTAQQRLLCVLGTVFSESEPFAVPALAPDVEPRFVVPAGPAATVGAVYDELLRFARERRTAGESGTAAVCASDARAFCQALAPALGEEGVCCSLVCTVPFLETLFGRAWLNACALRRGTVHMVQAATDFAYNAFSGMSASQARRFNVWLRADRLLSCEDACAQLRELSPTFSLFACLAETPDPSGTAVAFDGLRAFARDAASLGVQARACELEALEALAGLFKMADALGAHAGAAEKLAPALSVRMSSAAPASSAEGEARVEVRFLPASELSSLAPQSFDLVLLADVSDAAFNAAARVSALDALACKLGLAPNRSRLEEHRRAFAAAEEAARACFTCVMTLRTEAQEDAYPAFLFDEYVEALVRTCGAGASENELEPVGFGSFSLPRFLARDAVCVDEGNLENGMGRVFGAFSGVVELEAAHRGELAHLSLIDFLPVVQEGSSALPVLSPSALEAYIGCPYRWFVERRVRLCELDEGFSALEKGSFVHAVFAAFYDELAARGCKELGAAEGGLVADEALLDAVFDEVRAAQPAGKPGERLVSTNRSEELEVEALREQLHESLRRQASLPCGYHAWAHEYGIAPEDGINYAGARLNGRVDRIDVCEDAGRFVVLDYKGSLAGHAAGFPDDGSLEDMELPRKVQALVYAQALQRKLDGLVCAGALYLSYRARPGAECLAGSFDEGVYDVSDQVKDASCVHMSFARFLDVIEQGIEPYVRALVEGRIAPDSRRKDSCAHCPVVACERRSS